MKHYQVIFLIFCCNVQFNHGFFGKTFMKFREMLEEHRKSTFMKHAGLESLNEVEGYAFDQRVDHFEVRPTPRTFSHRYWRNTAYWKEPNGPVFLYVGGESALSGVEIYGGHIVEMAKQYGALLFSVEHRFYGRSLISLKDKDMSLLSSEQALADLAVFVGFAKKKFGISDKTKWITYGGSYPGALAAWFRIKYPHLVIGAVASSAPVKAQVNFEDYNNVVEASLSSQLVGGSEQCAANIKSAFQTMDNFVQELSFVKLKTDFLSCNDISKPNDTWTFFQNVASLVMSIVQYNGQMPGLEISTLCKYMTNSSRTPYDSLATLYRDYSLRLRVPCFDNSYNNFISELKNTVVGPYGNNYIRQWFYQTCTQFGFFQTCDVKTKCLFTKRLSLLHDLTICKDVFNIDPKMLNVRVNFTNQYYGSNKPKGSRIIFVNGSIDPWHALSILKNLTSSQIAIFIPGTSHCQNMGPREYSDPPVLKVAKQRIATIVGQWLKLVD